MQDDLTGEIGFKERFLGVISYLLFWISGAIILLVEKKNKFIRFHALQSVFTFGIFTVIFLLLSGIDWLTVLFNLWNYSGFGIVFMLLDWLLKATLFLFVLVFVLLVIKAAQGEVFKLPIIGDLAEERVYF